LTPVTRIAASVAATLAVVVAVSAAAIAVSVAVFGLRAPGAAALYFIVWWTLLFAILPFAVRSQAESGEVSAGTDPGAPSAPMLREKAIWTTLAASAAFIGVSWALPLAGL
jgi:predicted secreted protein